MSLNLERIVREVLVSRVFLCYFTEVARLT